MSSDFQKVLVKDDRLKVTDSIRYGVIKGGQNVTQAQYNAVSEAVSSHVFNIQVPSEQTLMDRRVLWQSTTTLQITVTTVAGTPAGINVFDYGLNCSLAPFPLHSMASTMTATLNNNSITQNTNDILPALLRLIDREELAKYNGYAPNAYDSLFRYTDGLGSNVNVLADYTVSAPNSQSPRGAWPLDSITAPTGTGVGANFLTTGGAGTATFTITFTTTEPLLMSPFLFANPSYNSMSLYGLQNLNFQFNMQPSNRSVRFAPPSGSGISYSIVPTEFNNTKLLLTFLTPHPSDLMPARNVVPYYELPRYISNQGTVGIANGASGTFNSQSLQLNQIPDKLIIFCRKTLATQTPTDSDSFLPIKRVRINFNNQSGILSGATQQDIYSMSIANLSNQSWYEFSGKANVRQPGGLVAGPTPFIPTVGSVLVLEFGKDIQLVEDYYAPGSLGNFQLQFQVDVDNFTGSAINGTGNPQYELVVITMNSGVLVAEKGTCSIYTGILLKQDVLDVSASSESYSESEVARLVGGRSFLDSLKSVAGMVAPIALPAAKGLLGSMDNPYAKGASGLLGALGYAKPKDKLHDRLA